MVLPIDKIKIDRSFIKNYPELDDGSLVKALIEMSNTLKKKVLAEGGETKEQIDYLRTIGCDYIQGYYYSKPLSFNAFIEFVSMKSKSIINNFRLALNSTALSYFLK